MKRVGGWLGAKQSASTQSLTSLDEPQALREAMSATAHILNDDLEAADAELAKGNSPFHKLGKGVVVFLRAVLGFEQEVMREASERLADAETAASEHQRRAHRDAYKGDIYPVGSEYALCYAESQLMSAVVAVLSESLTESIRGFYKLRKAYATLQEIAEAEKRYIRAKNGSSAASLSRQSVDSQRSVSSFNGAAGRKQADNAQAVAVQPSAATTVDEDDDLEFEDAVEGQEMVSAATQYQGHLDIDGASSKMSNLNLSSSAVGRNGNGNTNAPKETDEELDFADHFTHPIDIFIHSGTGLCFGILQLMLSLIPPTFSKLLSIIGFRGDRDEGLRLLWRATRYNNLNGAMAGLVLLGYYNVVGASVDILLEDAYPREKCRALLSEMRTKYPKSRLWLLEESRMRAGDKQLESAIELTGAKEKSPLKQVEALQCFEHSLNCMYLHRYEESAESFIKCVDLNNWSHGLYYYIAGADYVELYREAKGKNPAKAEKYAERATTLLRKVPTLSGKRRFMARQLPFDAFVTRKIAKWEARAVAWDVAFVDAIGVSPVEEMIYFWNGHKRMRAEQLEQSLATLAWSDASGGSNVGEHGVGGAGSAPLTDKDKMGNPTWSREATDEHAIMHVLRAAILRCLHRTAEAKELLETHVLGHDWSEWRGRKDVDNWTLPVAHYEMAVSLWVEAGGVTDSKEASMAKGVGTRKDVVVLQGKEKDEALKACAKHIDIVAKWEAFDLEARVGLKIRTAQDTLRKVGIVAAM